MNYKKESILAIGVSTGKNPGEKHTNGDMWIILLVSNVKLAYELGLKHERATFIKTPSLSYNQVNSRLKKEGKVLIYDKDKHESLDDAMEAAEYLAIKYVDYFKASKGEKVEVEDATT
jgi:hypothetical protein